MQKRSLIAIIAGLVLVLAACGTAVPQAGSRSSEGAASGAGKNGASVAAGGPSVSATGGIAPRAAVSTEEVFFRASFSVHYTSGPVMLAGSSDGTGTLYVDDILFIKVTHPNGSVSQFKNVFLVNGACTLGGQTLSPTDLSPHFQPGVNSVQVILKDKCGGGVSATQVWILP